jgi:hypothetical protein
MSWWKHAACDPTPRAEFLAVSAAASTRFLGDLEDQPVCLRAMLILRVSSDHLSAAEMQDAIASINGVLGS